MAFHVLCSLILATLVVTHASALKCRESLHGSDYITYYNVEDIANKITNPNIAFELHIDIKGEKDAHILLSPIREPSNSDSVYEIVLGAGRNTYIELRGNMKTNALETVNLADILSSTEFRSFYIRIYKGGLIVVGKEGEDTPLLSYTDKNPLHINYFSFSSFSDMTVDFDFDCSRSDQTTTKSITETTIEDVLSTEYDVYAIDTNVTETQITAEKTLSTSTDIEVTTTKIIPSDIKTEKTTTEEYTTINTTTGEFITIDKPDDNQRNKVDVTNQDKNENPHITASITIESSGRVSASLGPLTRNETSLLPSYWSLIAAIAKEIHGRYNLSDSHDNHVRSYNDSSSAFHGLS